MLLRRGWPCSSHRWTFLGEDKGLCPLPYSAGADVLVQRAGLLGASDGLAMCMLSPEGHGIC